MTAQIPVTVLTGFLGAGKTTLLNRILTEDHGRRYAVIINEFGETGIDNDLVVDADEEIFAMNNGCICCTVLGDLIRILDFAGQDDRFVVQAVHMLTDGASLGPWPKGRPRASKLVFIGRDLDRMGLAQRFAACRAD
jgi:G3E family GTPase